uniref:Uncharacterized protein n=1 Tax=Zea mays TaxID=4577 RepID=C4J8M0_MAIZE|nr:unknown [Zea mays]
MSLISLNLQHHVLEICLCGVENADTIQTKVSKRKKEDQNVMAMHSSRTSAKRSELMYLSPPLGNTVTIILPLFSCLEATFKQAARFAPEEMPTSRPSSLASLLAFAMASSVLTVTVSSMTEVSRTSGRNPGPTPWILCLPGAPPEITGLSAGSTQMILTPGFCIFRYFPTPETVPPVPEPATNTSTLPAVSFQISGPATATVH